MQLGKRSVDYTSRREFYIEKARTHKFLEDVVAGDTTFSEHLDWHIRMHYIAPTTFEESLDTLIEVSATGLDKGELVERYSALFWGAVKGAGQFFSVCAVGIGALLCAVGPLLVLEPLIVAAGASGIAALRKKMKYLADTLKRKDEIFEPVYRAAEIVDKEVGTIFFLDHFRHNRERFEETYTEMSRNEREDADELLYGYLAAGGMPGMDEIQVKQYLGGLLGPQGDAG